MIWNCIGRRSSSFHFFHILLLVISGSIQGMCIWNKKALQASHCCKRGLSFPSLECRMSCRRVRWGPWGLKLLKAHSSIELFISAMGSVCTESLRGATLQTWGKGLTSWQEDSHPDRKDTRNEKNRSPSPFGCFQMGTMFSEHLLSSGCFCWGNEARVLQEQLLVLSPPMD